MFKIAVLVSGGGTNLQEIIDNIENKRLNCKIEYIIADRDCYSLERGRKYNIKSVLLDKKEYGNKLSNEINKVLENKVDLIVLAGYLSIIDKDFISDWNNKIINIHPSLLPKYGGKGMYGMKVHEAVIANKEKKSGCTVHFVDVDIDTGKILLQRKVDVSNNETPESLQKKVLKEEHQLLIEAIEKVISDSVISDKGGI
ncbi:MAG: phosphoribosylglycinamide formyltransferase [Leptotrichiaceae bacterium]|nr:phosphoribosylglycinamide formyltransferase [Leptotrichiaceae bacterium]MBP9539016.1 phosphoribosylglycinamide formyltransferase [Leptotrichiaceae bacterium]